MMTILYTRIFTAAISRPRLHKNKAPQILTVPHSINRKQQTAETTSAACKQKHSGNPAFHRNFSTEKNPQKRKL